eukprot:7385679-Prymnesium_polylepis.1
MYLYPPREHIPFCVEIFFRPFSERLQMRRTRDKSAAKAVVAPLIVPIPLGLPLLTYSFSQPVLPPPSPPARTKHVQWWQGDYVWPGRSPPRCVIAPTVDAFCSAAGFQDTVTRIRLFHRLACAHRCALMPPPPRELLDHRAHNDGIRLDASVGWDRYLELTEGTPLEYVWQRTTAQRLSTVISDRRVKLQDINRLVASSELAFATQAKILTVDFHDSHGCQFYPAKQAFYDHLASTGPHDSHCKLPWPGVSARVSEAANNAASHLFRNNDPILVVHLRRGDRVPEHPSGIMQQFRKQQATAESSGIVWRFDLLAQRYSGHLGDACRAEFISPATTQQHILSRSVSHQLTRACVFAMSSA